MGIEPEISKIDDVYQAYLNHQNFETHAELAKMTDEDIHRQARVILESYYRMTGSLI